MVFAPRDPLRTHSTTSSGRRGSALAGTAAAAALLAVGVAAGPAAQADEGDAEAAITYVVTSAGDGADAAPRNGVCATAAGECTLRAAIGEANTKTQSVAINFNIPGSGTHTISPATKLPSLLNPAGITINGYTESGASPNTSPNASNAQIAVELRGKGSGAFDGLTVTTSNNVIRGLAIYNFHRQIYVNGTGANQNQFLGNFICTNAEGTFRVTSVDPLSLGIQLLSGPSNNAVGAPGAQNRNVVSGCGNRGITLSFAPTTNNKVQNNLVGLNPAGTNRLPNMSQGIDINYTGGNLVGGDGPDEGNVMSGNVGSGIEVSHGRNTRDNQVVGNFIGTDATGTNAPEWADNDLWGIRFEGPKFCGDPARQNPGGCTEADVEEGLPHDNSARGNVIVGNDKGGILIDKGHHHATVSGNRIGVTLSGQPAPNALSGVAIERGAYNNVIGPNNTIANNPVGVKISSNGSYPPGPAQRTYNNRVTQNTMYSNMGINLIETTQTTPGGINFVQNGIKAPGLRSVVGAVQGTTCAGCRVEVFVADTATARTGEDFLGATTATGTGSYSFPVSLPVGTPLTAKTTDPAGNSSEFAVPVASKG